jgi:PAS domain S-box-containing protein
MASPNHTKQVDLTRRILALGAVVVLILIGLAFESVIEDRNHGLKDANSSALELTRTLEAGLSATLQSAEVVVDYAVQTVLQQHLSGQSDMAKLPARFVALSEPLLFIQSVGFIAQPGSPSYTVLRDASNRMTERVSRIDFSARDTYAVHAARTRENSTLFLSDVRKGYVTDTPIVLLSKGIWGPTGQFLGIAAVGIRLNALRDVVNSTAPRVNGAITVFHTNGTLLLSEPANLEQTGRLPIISNRAAPSALAKVEQTYVVNTAIDGIERHIAYHVAQRYPIVVAISQSTTTILAPWRRASWMTAIATLVAVGVIGGLTLSLVIRMREQQGAQMALRDSEQRFRDMLECSSDYVWETDADENVIVFEGSGTELYPPIIGQPGAAFIAQTAEPNDLAKVLSCVRARKAYRNMFIPAQGVDGELRWVRSSANPRFDATGKFLGYRGVGSDVTEIRRARETTEALRKTEALGRLASGLAHEINNLLQPILIYSGFGTSSGLGDERDGYFTKIRRAAENASSIVRNVLSFTRRGLPHREAVSLAHAVREVLDMMSPQIPKDIRITVSIEALSQSIWVDRTGLHQALMNLITNALESLRAVQGDKRLTIGGATADAALSGRGAVRLSVSDNGPGILPAHITSVFDPFFTTKAQGQGTGLGLSVVAGLVRSWGGNVSVTSTPFEKTEFVLELPLAEAQLQAAQ